MHLQPFADSSDTMDVPDQLPAALFSCHLTHVNCEETAKPAGILSDMDGQSLKGLPGSYCCKTF
jgi:hypothetical protein